MRIFMMSLLLLAIPLHYAVAQTSTPAPVALPAPAPVPTFGAFDLVNQNGSRVTKADFKGSYILMTFGYTRCGAGCSPALGNMLQALQQLPSAKASRVLPVFVTLDPTRDSPAVLKQFLAPSGSRLIGLTGTPESIAAMARSYGVSYQGVENTDDAFERSLSPRDLAELRRDPQYSRAAAEPYTITHSRYIYLIGPDGTFATMANGDLPAAAIAKNLADAIK